MKIYFLITFFCIFSITAENIYSQSRTVSIKLTNATLKDAFRELEKNSDYLFLFMDNTEKGVSTIVNASFNNKSIYEIMDLLLKNTDLVYSIVNRQITISRKLTSVDNEKEVNNKVIIKEVQQTRKTITGTIRDVAGESIIGANIVEIGTSNGTITDINGNFTLSVETDATIQITYIGYLNLTINTVGNTNFDITLKEDTQSLEELVVVGYGMQAKKDIVGSVNVVSTNDLNTTPSTNMMSQLQGRSSGVMVSSTGDPDNSARVRIRGFSSYGNNDPLYIVDGVPTTNPAAINPQDIKSLQVLKDAVSASIYGARAANGVIIITTKQGQSNKTTFSFDSYMGVQVLPFNRTPELLNTAELMNYLDRTTGTGFIDPIFGEKGAYSIPEMYIVSNSFKGGVTRNNPMADPTHYTIADYNNIYQIFETSAGTDWYRAMSQTGITQSHQFSANGGTDRSKFSLGLNYLDQQGTFKYTGYDRFSVRLNSSFQIGKHITIGENMQLASTNRDGDNVVTGEGSAWSNAYRMSPFIPVYDINGGYGGTLIGGTSGVGQNPLAVLERRKNWTNQSFRAFGNLYSDIMLFKDLKFHTSLGLDLMYGNIRRATLREYEKSEANKITQLNEANSRLFNWTWSNTLTYQKALADHDVKVLLGTEAMKNTGYNLNASKQRFDFENDEFLSLSTGLPETLGDITAISSRYITTLASYFTRVDYGFRDKYLLSATYRIDGSSLFGSRVRYGKFPSVGLAWRVSEENFIKNSVSWIDDLKIRTGWGLMGSVSNVPVLNQFSSFSSTANNNFYDINSSNIGSTQGYGVNTIGNEETKWETTETANIGLDLSIAAGRWNMTIDVYQNDTRDLLVPSMRNGMEMIATRPLINLGTMRNRGVDIGLVHRGTVSSDFSYDIGINFTRYRNELTKLNDEDSPYYPSTPRLSNFLITDKGIPISSFYGYAIDGFYNSQEDVENGPKINGSNGQIGSWRFKDIDGDNNITVADRTVIGSPHPDFQMGLDIKLNWKNFDFNVFAFWNQGSQIFNYTKFFTYMGPLGGAVARGKLYDAWTPQTASTAKTPQLGVGNDNGYTSFITGNPSSFYIEDGSYLRVKTLQLGYSIPSSLLSRLHVANLRIYLQVQNLFTFTKYQGADPDLGLISGDSTDQNLGVDYSGYPNPKIFMVGLNLNF